MSAEPASPVSVRGPRAHRNSDRMVGESDPVWQAAADRRLIELAVDVTPDNHLVDRQTGHRFLNMCSYSYLGLNRHPAVIEGGMAAMREHGMISPGVGATRISPGILGELEQSLGDLFGAPTLTGLSCSVVTSGILPLLAAGHIAEGGPRVMVFDRFAHFSLAYAKPICADESLVLTGPHNDLDFLEDVCRRHPRVAYVADGAYSTGGTTVVEGLLDLQDRYGLFLYFDDAHSLSIVGERGEGFVRSQVEMNPLTMIVASLNKGFGVSGGIAMLGRPELARFLKRHGGPLGWSQKLDTASIGFALASAGIHRSAELGRLQRRLRDNIDLFDRLLPTPLAGNGLPVRRIHIGDAEAALEAAAALYRRGYYASAIFFPIVPRGAAGLRIMLRADLTPGQITEFAAAVKELVPAAAIAPEPSHG